MRFTLSGLLHGSGRPLDKIHRPLAWRKFKHHATVIESPSIPSPVRGKKICFLVPWPSILWKLITSCVSWTVPVRKVSRQLCSVNLNQHLTSHDHLRSERQSFFARSSRIVLRRSFPPSAVHVVLLALDWLLGFFGFCEMVCVPRDVSMFTTTTKAADQGAKINKIAFATTTNVHALQLCWSISEGTQAFGHAMNFGIQHGVVVLGVMNALLYADNQHRSNKGNPSNYEICMEGALA